MAHDVVAVRGVCIGPGQHLMPGERATLDRATFQFLHGIGAVKPAPAPEPDPNPPTPARSAGKKES